MTPTDFTPEELQQLAALVTELLVARGDIHPPKPEAPAILAAVTVPRTVKAVLWDGENTRICETLRRVLGPTFEIRRERDRPDTVIVANMHLGDGGRAEFRLDTHELMVRTVDHNWCTVPTGAYVMLGDAGYFYPCDAEVFAKRYRIDRGPIQTGFGPDALADFKRARSRAAHAAVADAAVGLSPEDRSLATNDEGDK